MKQLTLFVYLLCTITSFGQLNQFEISAQQTNPNIDLDTLPNGSDTIRHQIFVDQSTPFNGKLLLFLPGTGAKPGEHYAEFCKAGANLGYRVIGLVYKNTTSVSQSCGTMSGTSDPECSEDMRLEVIYGVDSSGIVDVNHDNSIMNRFSSLLYFLTDNFNQFNWDDFIDTASMNIHWDKIAVAGHSQGGGHAALIARDTVVNRVLLFNSPSDKNTNLFSAPLYQPDWFFDSHVTHDSSYYAFFHMQNLGPTKLLVYEQFGLSNYGAEVNVDLTSNYGGTHILYTDSITFDYLTYTDTSCNNDPVLYDPHSDIIVDCEVPRDLNGNLAFTDVWEYMLTNTSDVLSIEETQNTSLSIYPNPVRNLLFVDVKTQLLQRIELFDLKGRLIFATTEHHLSMEPFKSGVYVMRIYTNEGTEVFKVLKE